MSLAILITDDNRPPNRLSALIDTPVDFLEIANSHPTDTRRALKTHLPYNLLPTEMLTGTEHKMIYIVRNPKDAAVSVFHHYKNVHGFYGTLTDKLEGVLKGEALYGSYFRHVDEFVRLSEVKDNLLLVRYEDMVTDIEPVIKKINDFLGIRMSDADVKRVANYVHFDQMKDRKSSNFQDFTEAASLKGSGEVSPFKFLRKGQKDSHKEEMPPEWIERYDQEMRKWDRVMALYPDC